MAWPNPTFTARSFGELAGDLSALMVGVNQRELSIQASDGTGTLTSVSTTVIGASTIFTSQLESGNAINAGGESQSVDTITDNTHMTVLSEYGTSSAGSGTISSSGTAITGVGTSFLSEVSIGDRILSDGQIKTIASISDDTNMATTASFSPALSSDTYLLTSNGLNGSAFSFLSQTKFTIADGTKKAQPLESDLLGFVFGEDGRGTRAGTGTISSSGAIITGTGTIFNDELETGDTITATSTTNGTGTLSSSGTTVTGSGTAFTTEQAVGDTITSDGQTKTIDTITDDDTLDTTVAFDAELSADSFTFSRIQNRIVNNITNDTRMTTTVAFSPTMSTDSYTIPGGKLLRDIIIEVQDAAKLLISPNETAGSGTLSSSGAVVTGSGTSFTTELATGGTIIVGSQAISIFTITDNDTLNLNDTPNPAFSGDSFTFIQQLDDLPAFIESTTDETKIIHNSLIADIGLTDLTGSEDFSTTFNWWDENVWERLRQYLDALTITLVSAARSSVSGTVEVQIGPGGSTTASAWAATLAATPFTDGVSLHQIGYSVFSNYSPPPTWGATITRDSEKAYITSGLSGTVSRAIVKFIRTGGSVGPPPDIFLAGVEIPHAASGSVNVPMPGTPGEDTTLILDTDSTAQPGALALFCILQDPIYPIVDISSALTDQA